MYELLYGSRVLHNPLDDVFALDCECKLSLTAPGELSFKLNPTHPLYGEIELLQKNVEIVLSDDGEELFRGRAMEKTVDFDGNEEYVCEGNLAYLNDILLRPYSTEDPGMPHDPSGYFNFLINSYNQYAAAKDTFAVGRNEANRIKPTIDRENSNLVTVRQELKDKMLDPLGGYTVMRHEGGRWYIDYLADGGKESAQRIEFGENLTDYMRMSSAYERYTAVVPVGEDADGNPVDISALPDGIVFEGIRKEGDRLIDVEAAALFGIIEYDLSSDAALPVNVQANGISFLRTNKMGDTLEIKAVDMHLVDSEIERIGLGDYTRVISDPHGVDNYFLCIGRDLKVSEPDQDAFVLGTEQGTLTDAQAARIAALNAGIDKTFEEAKGASQAAKDAAKDAEEKARIFTAQPVPPYSVGDLWSQGAGGDILKCEHDRSDGERFDASDWMPASKYTDDALAELAKEAAEAAKDAADQAFADAKNASDKALEAKNAADEATAKTEVVESQVTEVRQSAKTAQDAADAAQATANDAQDKAGAAESAAVIAQDAAEAARGSALDAATSAGEAVSVANEAKKQIGDVAADAVKLREDLEGQIAAVSTTMEADYSKKTDLTATESKLITQIEQSAAAIKLEASQSYAKKTDLTDVETALNAKIEVNASGIEQAVKEVTTAKADASEAKTKAQAAETAAGAASSEAAQAAAAASGAQGAADAAKADAMTAQQKANDAKNAADKAQEDFDDLSIRADVTDEQLAAAREAVDAANKAAGTAQSAADAAKGAANAAQQTADKAKTDSATAKAAADAAKAKADEAADAVAGLEGRVTTAETKITQNANAITSVASRTTAVENKFGGYSTTEQMNSAIQQKADSITQSVSKTYATQATVNDVKKTADAAKRKVVHYTTGTSGAAGIFLVAEIKIKGQYANTPIKITVSQRNRKQSSVYIAFASSQNYDPSYSRFDCDGDSVFYLARPAAGTWNLYVPKTESYDCLTVVDLDVDGYLAEKVAVTWKTTQVAAVANLPAGYVTATKLIGKEPASTIATKAELKIESDRITSNVAETTKLGTRMSTVEQTASGLTVQLGNVSSAKYLTSNYVQPLSTVKVWSAEGHTENWTVASTSGVRVGDTAYVRVKVSDANAYVYVVVSVTTVTSATAIKGVSHGFVDQSGIDASIAAAAAQSTANTANGTANTAKTNAATAQSTADAAKANAATAQTTANTANSTANTAKTNAATAQSTANTARNEAAAAGKTATNFLEFSSSGLDVGNKSSGKWAGFRTRMASSAFQVLNAAGTVLASYGASLIELGKNSASAIIKMCGGIGTMCARTGSPKNVFGINFDVTDGGGNMDVDTVIGGYQTQVTGSLAWLYGNVETRVGNNGVPTRLYGNVYLGSNLLSGDVNWLYGTGAAFTNICTNRSSAYPVYGAKILYNNASGVWGTITLNETAANFKYMEFYYKKPEGDHFWNCSKVHDPNNKRVGFLVAQVSSDPSVTQTLMGGVAIVGTSVSIYTNSRYNNGPSWVLDSTTLRIYRVVGYR